jgi:hypothetical protein
MTALSLVFAVSWILALITAVAANGEASQIGGNELPVPAMGHEHVASSSWLSATEAAKNIAATLAILVAGGWAFYNFVIRREGKPVLEIDLSCETIPNEEGRFLVYFDVTLTNKSKRQVLTRKRRPGQPAFYDRNERLQHSCSLLLRRVDAGAPLTTQVGWFSTPNVKSPLPTDIVMNLAEGYEYDVEGKTDFFVEPTEASHLSVGAVLEPGIYLALVTVVGQPSDDREFWRRQFLVQIPRQHAILPKADSV